MSDTEPLAIQGSVSACFEPMHASLEENLLLSRKLGGACCVYHRGEKVVDLWGGVRHKATQAPWEQDTIVLVYSATKGLSAKTQALAHSRGWLDYEQPVCRYWPEFAQQGKDSITVRQLLAHQAGLFAFDEPVDRSVVTDLDRLAAVLARQKPAWEPGTRQACHAISLGFYQGELMRRIDLQHRSLGQFFQDEIATPLSLEFYIRLPESIPDSRPATLEDPSAIQMPLGFPLSVTLSALNPRSIVHLALIANPGAGLPHDADHIYTRNLEVPSGGGVGTARAIAKAYGVFADGGRELGLRPQTLALLAAPAVPAAQGCHDEFMEADAQFSLGFMKSNPGWSFGSVQAYGSPGAGGSLGYADPTTGIGYAYVTNRKSTHIEGDPRDIALRRALDSIVPP